MNVWVIYDIESTKAGNKRRAKIAKTMEQMGLYRVQKSVFSGNLAKNRLDELTLFAKNLINPTKDSVYLFPLCEADFKGVRTLGLGFDKELISDSKREMFL